MMNAKFLRVNQKVPRISLVGESASTLVLVAIDDINSIGIGKDGHTCLEVISDENQVWIVAESVEELDQQLRSYGY